MSPLPRVLLVDDEPTILTPLADRLTAAQLFVKAVGTGREALALVEQTEFDVAVLDLKLPDTTGIDVLRRIVELGSDTDVVMMTAHGTIPTAVEAMKLGARDFLTKPFEAADLLDIVRRYVRVREARRGALSPRRGEIFHGMVGESPAMRELFRLIPAVAESDAPVLLHGETGTGKELVARAIHQSSPRRDAPFVTVSCALVEEPDLACEATRPLGAATPLARARGGTLFLDEVGDLPAIAQARLLQSMQAEDCATRRGEICGARFVASSRVDLRDRAEQGAFREDLFHRLNVLPLRVPPLRERREDVLLLAEHFLREIAASAGRPTRLSGAAKSALSHYAWPGNVRELLNVISRAVTLSLGEGIECEHLGLAKDVRVPLLASSVQAEEDRRIDQALAQTGGRKAQAAALLGISRKALWEKLKRRGKV